MLLRMYVIILRTYAIMITCVHNNNTYVHDMYICDNKYTRSIITIVCDNCYVHT